MKHTGCFFDKSKRQPKVASGIRSSNNEAKQNETLVKNLPGSYAMYEHQFRDRIGSEQTHFSHWRYRVSVQTVCSQINIFKKNIASPPAKST
mmetsp:Transcript_8537/g.11100  ORF Transcript_8537/g.11100 Transcript_8537/m.11100 type:complete len:92 (-) Transcript_8537:694-969(-)